jgi:multidrug resistance efflux pump
MNDAKDESAEGSGSETWRRTMYFLSDTLEWVRKPGWPRRILVLVILTAIAFIPVTVHVSGDFEITSSTSSEVRTPIAGTLIDVPVHTGDRVVRGQVLAALEDKSLEDELSRLLPQLAEVQLLIDEKGTLKDDLLNVQKARMARREVLERRISLLTVRADGSGMVVTPDQEIQRLKGQVLPEGAMLMEVIDPASLVARVWVPESEFGDVKVGMPVTLRTFQYPTEALESTIERIEPRVEKKSEFATSVPVIAKLAHTDFELRPRTTGRAKIDGGRSFLGYIIYRRFLRSAFVQLWSWF